MRLSPKASREVEEELSKPAADTPERRRMFEGAERLWRQMELEREEFRKSQQVSGRASRRYLASLRKPGWRKYWQVLATLLAIGCVSGPTIPAPIRDAEACLSKGPCVVVEAENQFLEPAAVYLNGERVAELAALENRVIWVRESRLVEGHCLYARVSLRMSSQVMTAGRECIAEGGHFSLKLTQDYLFLVPWR